ncbi:sigma-70 family RNA polymerase sigma factor [Pseudopedobacter sp.]|uniref:RNA polymerase sigma factor n=1 Tax=Pseudopedobacter sp. TaxID=1936787 RepID=UPI003340F9D3
MKSYSLYTLEDLLVDIKADDSRAFDELYARTWKELYIKAYSKLKHEDLAKDIVQEIFVDLWNKRHVKAINNVKAYLAQSVKFKVLDEFRKNRYEFIEIENFTEEIKENVYADSKLLDKEFFASLKDWIDSLPHKRKEIFRLKYQEGLSNKEIALKLNISPKTVQNQVLNSSPELYKLLRRALFILFLIFFGI